MKIISTLLCIALTLICAYFIIGIATVIKNGTSITQSPGILVRLKTFFTTNSAETSDQSPYPELKPRQYKLDSNIALIKVVKDSANLLGYHYDNLENNSFENSEEKPEGEQSVVMNFVATTPLFKFKDDIQVSITTPNSNQKELTTMSTTINAHSKSRVGRADFGANIANIVQFFNELDKQLGKVK